MSDDENYSMKEAVVHVFSLCTSMGTLICCALPALFVSIGAGAALAGLVSNVPWLVALSKYKVWVFVLSGAMILAAGIMRFKMRNAPCPIDPDQANACMRLRRMSKWMYWASVLIWCIGFFFAFIAVHLLG